MSDFQSNSSGGLEPIAADGVIPASVMSMVRAGLKYKKTATVKAVQTVVDTPHKTVLKNGTLETERIVPAGSFIVTNPSGEQYGIDAVSFAKRYEAADVEGVYLAKGEPLPFVLLGTLENKKKLIRLV